MAKIIAGIIVILFVAFLGYAATQPDTFRVERAIVINAAPDKIFPLLDNYRSWMAWSPYEKKDPAMKRIYSGTESGKGAVYSWDGNSDVGAGTMETVESLPSSLLKIDMKFTRPMENQNMSEFALAPQGEATLVTWSMYGSNPYIAKVMGTIFNMDKMIGADFEVGLADLKIAAEK